MSEAAGYGAGLTVYVQHHLPVGRPNALMETKPHLSPAAQRVLVALGRREEGAADRSVSHAGQVPHHHVQRLK